MNYICNINFKTFQEYLSLSITKMCTGQQFPVLGPNWVNLSPRVFQGLAGLLWRISGAIGLTVILKHTMVLQNIQQPKIYIIVRKEKIIMIKKYPYFNSKCSKMTPAHRVFTYIRWMALHIALYIKIKNKKKSAYGRQRISRPMQIVAPIPKKSC